MKVAFIGEGVIDNVLLPPLITTIARVNGVNWPIDFRNDITMPIKKGFGGVKYKVRHFINRDDHVFE